MLIHVNVRAVSLPPFGALDLVRFGPDSHEDHDRVRRAVVDHARCMGWTEIAQYRFAPTCVLLGDDAAGEPHPLRTEEWSV